jgi:hypothetical protein
MTILNLGDMICKLKDMLRTDCKFMYLDDIVGHLQGLHVDVTIR